jgi:hypothetical protein
MVRIGVRQQSLAIRVADLRALLTKTNSKIPVSASIIEACLLEDMPTPATPATSTGEVNGREA